MDALAVSADGSLITASGVDSHFPGMWVGVKGTKSMCFAFQALCDPPYPGNIGECSAIGMPQGVCSDS